MSPAPSPVSAARGAPYDPPPELSNPADGVAGAPSDDAVGEEPAPLGITLEVLQVPFEPADFDGLLDIGLLARFHIIMCNGTFVLSN